MNVRPILVLFATLLAALAPTRLTAQPVVAWRLPTRAVVEYTRTAKSTFAAKEVDRGKPPSSAAIRNGLHLGHIRNPPLLYQAELDPRQLVSTETPTSFWDIIPYVALDLQTAKARRMRYDLPRITPIGDLRLNGRSMSLEMALEKKPDETGKTGAQTLRFDLQSRETEVRDGPKKYFRVYIANRYQHGFRGRLTIHRTVDVEEGRVLAFTAKLEGEFTYPRNSALQSASAVFEEDWKLRRVHGHRDMAFRTDVAKAITDGAQYIRSWVKGLKAKNLRPDGVAKNPRSRRSYNTGRLALCLLTMINAELDRKDEVVQFALQELRERKIFDTYSAALAVMAFEAYYAPPGERNDLISGILKKPRKRVLPAADAALVAKWCKQILHNQDTRMDKGYRLAFDYTRGPRYDHSVNQYALLGLYSGHLCGVEISSSIWLAAARHLIEQQRKDYDKKVRLDLVTYREQTQRAADPTVTRSAMPSVVPMGWSYYSRLSRGNMAYGSMTSAGIAGLTICAAALRDLDMSDNDIMPQVSAALQGGYAFMGHNFSVRANCGYAPKSDYHRYYYLYSMERAFELSGIAEVMGRDWYHEGAMHLLAWRKKNGSYPPARPSQSTLETTSFAVLFLKKAALPVYTGK